VVLCGFKLGFAVRTAGREAADVEPWRQLAVAFRETVGDNGTPVVHYIGPQGIAVPGGDFLWFSYFARTAMPWCGSPDCPDETVFPRGRIYSFRGKMPDYVWVPERHAGAAWRAGLKTVNRVYIDGVGVYELVRTGNSEKR
jgi:hypothetical protein